MCLSEREEQANSNNNIFFEGEVPHTDPNVTGSFATTGTTSEDGMQITYVTLLTTRTHNCDGTITTVIEQLTEVIDPSNFSLLSSDTDEV